MNEFEINRAQKRLPGIDLYKVPYEGREIMIAENRLCLADNLLYDPKNAIVNKDLSGEYYHSDALPVCTFRPALTQESIAAARYVGENKYGWRYGTLELGKIYITPDGVFTNTDEKELCKRFGIPEEEMPRWVNGEDYFGAKGEFYIKRLRKNLRDLVKGAAKVDYVYFIDDAVAFVPYHSFNQGWQYLECFPHSGLARALEHTTEKTVENLNYLSSLPCFPDGVYVEVNDRFALSAGDLARSTKINIVTETRDSPKRELKKAFVIEDGDHHLHVTRYGVLEAKE